MLISADSFSLPRILFEVDVTLVDNFSQVKMFYWDVTESQLLREMGECFARHTH